MASLVSLWTWKTASLLNGEKPGSERLFATIPPWQESLSLTVIIISDCQGAFFMAKKNAHRRSTARVPEAGNPLPTAQLSAFDMAFQEGEYSRALRLAEAMVQRYPGAAQAHELYANVLGRLERFSDASEAMERLANLVATPGAAQRLKLAQYQVLAGKAADAVAALEEVVEVSPAHLVALVWLSRAYHQLGNNRKALEVNDRALALDAGHEEALLWRARILDQLKCHDDALETLERLLAVNPKHIGVHNHIATLYVKEGGYKAAEAHFSKELELDPANSQVHSNLLMAAHYNPEYSAQDIFAKALEWDKCFAEPSPSGRADTLKEPAKKLRIGLLSGGFRMHPVGQMILPALQHLSFEQFEITAYSTNQLADKLTHEIRQAVHHWQVIEGLSDSQLDQRIRDDGIDILIDMNGAGEGSRYTALTREPAPLIVKWVGSLINTTGLSCFDYLFSDAIETPEGVDKYYTEKLIRLPDDYICYNIPEDAPPGGALPALSNGYITFGCLNNPAKLSPPMLAEWAVLLHETPGSKLLLKGVQFDSERYRNKVIGTLAEHGISSDRLILEGPAQHREFMATYQRIDIALDTWPYSGGLTTCEALLMGVPVVTRVGPTFAGRHSATHLVNAGLPELVTDSWENFRIRAKELANDLPSLAVIRASLRTILMDSPICNGPRFANHLTTALRAIWQRHCEGKKSEALTFSKSGAAQFADEDSPVKLALALPSEGFDWQLESPIVAVDNGAVLASRPDARELLGSGRVVMLSFDPGRNLETVDHLAQYGEIQHFPYTALGDGQPANLYVDDGAEPTTLAPLVDEGTIEQHQIPTVALDSIEGLPCIDLLALDANHDSLKALEHAAEALRNTLLIQARVVFQPRLQKHPDFSSLNSWMERHGFRFYRFNDEKYCSHFSDSVPEEKRQATELVSADTIFLPSHKRMALLSNIQRIKLAFILHTMLGAKDIAYALLSEVSEKLVKKYLADESLLTQPKEHIQNRPHVADKKILPNRKVFIVGFPKSGTSTLQKALEDTGYSSAHWKVEEGFVGQLMYKGLYEKDDPWYYLKRYDSITQGDVCIPSHGINCWPNLDFNVIKKIQEKHPDCLFVLNYRDPRKTVSSMGRWGDMKQRFKKSEIPGLPAGSGSDKELEEWIVAHMNKVREFFAGSSNFVEIDIEDESAPNKLSEKLGIKLAWWGVANRNASAKKSASGGVTIQADANIENQADIFTNHLLAGKKADAGECLKAMLYHHDLGAVRQAVANTIGNRAWTSDVTMEAGQLLRSTLPTLNAPPEYPPFRKSESPLVYVVGTSNARGFGSSPYFLSFFSFIGAEAYLLQGQQYQDTLTRTSRIIERLEPGRPVLLILGAEPRLLLENRFNTRPQAFGELMDSDYRHMEAAAKQYRALGVALQEFARGPLYFMAPLPTLSTETNVLTKYMIERLHQEFEGTGLGVVDPFEAFIDASTGLMDTRLQIIKNESELHFNHEGLEIIMSRLVDQGLLPPGALSTPQYHWDNMIPIKMGNQETKIWNDPARSLKSEMTAATMMMDNFVDYLHGHYLQKEPCDLVIFNARQGFLPIRMGGGLSLHITTLSLDDVDTEMCRRLITFAGRQDISVCSGDHEELPRNGDLIVCVYPDDDMDVLKAQVYDIIAIMQPAQLFAFIPETLTDFNLQFEGYTECVNFDIRRRHIAKRWQNCRLLHLGRDN